MRVLPGVGFGPWLLAMILPPWSTFLRLPSLATAEDLVAKVARGAELQRVLFSRNSLQFDYSRCLSSGRAGKTAAIVAFRGKGAKLQYTELAMTAQASIALAGDGLLPVTPA